MKKQGKGCARLFLFSHILVPGTVPKDRNKEKTKEWMLSIYSFITSLARLLSPAEMMTRA